MGVDGRSSFQEGEDGEVVAARIRQRYVDEIDEWVDDGEFPNRSDALRAVFAAGMPVVRADIETQEVSD